METAEKYNSLVKIQADFGTNVSFNTEISISDD
jgi:hypothetical protein